MGSNSWSTKEEADICQTPKGRLTLGAIHKLCRLIRGEEDQKLPILHSKKTIKKGGEGQNCQFLDDTVYG